MLFSLLNAGSLANLIKLVWLTRFFCKRSHDTFLKKITLNYIFLSFTAFVHSKFSIFVSCFEWNKKISLSLTLLKNMQRDGMIQFSRHSFFVEEVARADEHQTVNLSECQ